MTAPDTKDSLLAPHKPMTREDRHILWLEQDIARLRLQLTASEKRLDWISSAIPNTRVVFNDTGVTPYRVCLNGVFLGASVRECIDKAILAKETTK